MDVAIQGDGFFGVYMQDGTVAYSRDGCFQLDAEPQLVNSSGYRVVWSGTLPENISDVDIDSTGAVYATVDGEKQALGILNYIVLAIRLDCKAWEKTLSGFSSLRE